MQGLFLFIALAIAYLFPTAIAYQRGHQSQGGIATLNILLGWSLIGWVIALIWSCSAVRRSTQVTGPAQDGQRQDGPLCPYCRAEVDPRAKKCRHCGEWIEGQVVAEDAKRSTDPKPQEKPAKDRARETSLQDVQSLNWRK